MEPSFLSQFSARLTAETPIFFKKLVKIGLSISGIGASILGIGALPIALPHTLIVVAGYMVTIGIVTSTVAKSATIDPNLQAQGGSNVVINQSEAPPQSTEADQSPPIPKV